MKGAFTGATTARLGLFVEADDGTLLLDEMDARCGGNKTRAAELLGIDVSTIHRRERADIVRTHLVRLGVEPQHIKVLSFGEERPADEHALEKNRRAEFSFRAAE